MMKRFAQPLTDASEARQLGVDLVDILANGDLSDAMAECAQLADQAFGRNFAAAAGRESGPWPARKQGGSGLADANHRTIGTHPLEILSGEMFLAVTSPLGAGHIEDVGPRGAELGVDPDVVPYESAQNYGHTYDDGRVLPQREFVDISEADADAMAEVVADELERLLSR